MEGRPCGWCSHVMLHQWEARLAAGDPISVVAVDTPYSATAARRHVRLHLKPRLRAEMGGAGAPVSLSDFVDRLMDLVEQAAAVGSFAVATSNGKLALQAIQQESSLLVTLMNRLGIESSEVVEELNDARAVVTAIGQLVHDNELPGLVPALASSVEAGGRVELAQSLIRTAYKIKEVP